MNEKRLTDIMNYLQLHQNAYVSELCEALGVSDMTIRRDLIQLEKRNKIIRFHGGATVTKDSSSDSFNARLDRYRSRKEEIAEYACEYLKKLLMKKEYGSVFFGSGTTVYQMTKHLTYDIPVPVITDNTMAAAALAERTNNTVFMVGGQLMMPSYNSIGFLAEKEIRDTEIDIAFIGTYVVDGAGSLYVDNMLEYSVNRAIIETAKKVIVLADHTKFDRNGIRPLCTMDDKFTIITDSGIDQDVKDHFLKMGLELLSY